MARPGAPRRPSITETEHEDFRAVVRAFLEAEVVPHHAQWEADGIVPRELWRKAGALGLLCFDVEESYGGAGVSDFRYNLVMAEELGRVGASGVGFPVHTDVIVPYISSLGTDEQKRRWLPGLVGGDLISAIAMTEPGAGSDLQGIRTSAVDAGEHWVLNGSKTFISNGINADLVIVVARTDPDAGHRGMSLLVVERGMAGFERGRNLAKMGLHAQDTAELSFTDVRVPKENTLGEPGTGFASLMANLPQERISIACLAVAAIESVVEQTLAHVTQREAFGRPIGAFQNTRFVLAEMATEAHVARVFVNDCVLRLNAGEVDPALAAMAKWWTTELQKRIVDAGVQMHGGYGYMSEYPISRAYTDSRVQTIYGGTTEIQKEIIGRSLGL
jgi:alkylation response protein AidB-like acyl-CoA dehydrogenase